MKRIAMVAITAWVLISGCGRAETVQPDFDAEAVRLTEDAKTDLGEGAEIRFQKAFIADADGDGDDDQVLVFELGSGDSSFPLIALSRREGAGISSIGPFLLGKLLEWGVDLGTVEVVGQEVKMNFYQFEEGDPRCCPSVKGRMTLKWTDEKLTTIAREIDEPSKSPSPAIETPLSNFAQFRGLSIGMAAAQMHSAELGGGGIRATPIQTAKEVWEQNSPDKVSFYKITESCAAGFDALIRDSQGGKTSMMAVLNTVKCPLAGFATLDSAGKVIKLSLFLTYFSADIKTSPENFMRQLIEKYGVQDFSYLGHNDELEQSWEGFAKTGETLTVSTSKFFGLMLEVENRESAQFD